MTIGTSIGVLLILLGCALVLLRNQFSRLIHWGLTKFYGEPVADMAVNPRTGPRWMVFVGIGGIAMGAFNIVEGLVGS